MPVLASLVIGLNSTALTSGDQPPSPSRTFLWNFESSLPVCSVMCGLSASFQVAMPAPHTRRSPVWSNAELLDLISIWGEEAVQSQLRFSCRNYDTYRLISRCMTERGHDRDTLQCRVKVKELWNAYYKAWEANPRSGAVPKSCRFYKELDEIGGGDPTSTAKTTVDTSVARMPVKSGLSQEEKILDKDVEGEGDPEAEDDLEARDACSQELFFTPEEPIQSRLSEP
ncbi:Zinc finger and SCAN domain-containing protein 20 [Chelonia mydas]|uniref:Zinc finger and SCAN domain-containing protein 20 n=1 Tax=Chelonia mydas TaxID=8469 RepID=M7CAC3_CHEMY|nr:Zinc finger and SCAN domain-containing protein 20 [Chelonia mydas]